MTAPVCRCGTALVPAAAPLADSGPGQWWVHPDNYEPGGLHDQPTAFVPANPLPRVWALLERIAEEDNQFGTPSAGWAWWQDTAEELAEAVTVLLAYREEVTVLHVRDPDGYCQVSAYSRAGVELPTATEDVDAGAGHEAADWRQRITDAEAEPDTPYRAALLEALTNPPGASYIDGWDDPEETP